MDLFGHESLHAYGNMRRKLEPVRPRLRAGGVLIADDVERNRAFGELREKTPALWRVVRARQERPLHDRAVSITTFGLAIK